MAKSRWFKRVCLSAALTAIPSIAAAGQAVFDQNLQAAQAEIRGDDRAKSQIVYPFGVSGTPLTSAGLTAGQEGKSVFLKLAFKPDDAVDFVLNATGALDDSEDRSQVVQLTGLSNKTTFGAEMRWGHHRLPSPAENARILRVLLPECHKGQEIDIAKLLKEREDTGIIELGCDLDQLSRDTIRRELEAYRQPAVFFSVKGEASPERFEFLAGETFADAKVVEWSSSAELVVGALFPKLSKFKYFALGLNYTNVFEAEDEVALCEPATAAAKFTCPMNIVGAPESERHLIVEVESRGFLNEHVGLSMIARHDWETGDTSLEAPLYVIKDEDGGLAGGVSQSFTWSTNESRHGYRAFLFVSQRFALKR